MAAGRTYETIATTSISSATASITFNSIPQTYTDIVLTMSPVLSTDSYPYLRFNGDTGSSYSDLYMGGNHAGTIYGSFRSTQSRGYISENVTHLTDSNSKTNILVNIMSYTGTANHKTWLVRSNAPYSGTYSGVELMAGRWANTAAITSITVGTAAGGTDYNLGSGTVISLYGIARA